MFRLSTMIYSSCDPAATRPVVVVTVPPPTVAHSKIQVATRTSQLNVRGVQHPANRSLQCEKSGVFSDLASVEQQLWRPEHVEYLGTLGEPYLARVLERFT